MEIAAAVAVLLCGVGGLLIVKRNRDQKNEEE